MENPNSIERHAPGSAPFPTIVRREATTATARTIAGWAFNLADDYEKLASNATMRPGEIGQKLQDHDQYVGAAAAMRAMVEKIEGEFSL